MSHYTLDDSIDFGPDSRYERLDLEPASPLANQLPGGLLPGGPLRVETATLQAIAHRAFSDIAFLMPTEQLEGFASILSDPTASAPERFVAAVLLRNAAIAAEGVLPVCQDTGTALVYGWKGASILTNGGDEDAIAAGARSAWAEKRLRNSQLGPIDFVAERNTKDNLPARIELRATKGSEYRLCFTVKGGGSVNRTSFSIESPALLESAALEAKLRDRITSLGSSACPPYRVSIVLGGASPDETLRALALAGLGLLDSLPGSGLGDGAPLRDRGWEAIAMRLAAESGVGAQFGGSRLALDARAIRLSRHAASLPFATGVVCSAHRRILALVRRDGVFLERLERDPGRFLPPELPVLPDARKVDLDRPMPAVLAEIASFRAGAFLLLSGTVVVARDVAHARFRQAVAAGKPLPEYLKEHPVFYAGPTEAAPGAVSGSFGPTTAGRMDAYLDMLMSRGASLVSIAKGGRSAEASGAIARHGGAYLGCIGGAAALAAHEHIVSSEIVDFADLGMEAVRRVVIKDLPAVVLIDSRGESFPRDDAGNRG